jgi:hypothetical protein
VGDDYDMRTALGVLLDGPVVVEELRRELGWPEYRTDDALAALRRAGLAHRRAAWRFPLAPR